ncbi:MAG: hypothetical protein MRY74_11505 [Neomegalonema sp.]|nr:hypothetical protein [Neomegalonema sp.]
MKVQGLPRGVLERADEAARDAGRPLGEWLNAAIETAAEGGTPQEPARAAAAIVRDAVDEIGERIDAALGDAARQNHRMRRLTEAVIELANRLEYLEDAEMRVAERQARVERDNAKLIEATPPALGGPEPQPVDWAEIVETDAAASSAESGPQWDELIDYAAHCRDPNARKNSEIVEPEAAPAAKDAPHEAQAIPEAAPEFVTTAPAAVASETETEAATTARAAPFHWEPIDPFAADEIAPPMAAPVPAAVSSESADDLQRVLNRIKGAKEGPRGRQSSVAPAAASAQTPLSAQYPDNDELSERIARQVEAALRGDRESGEAGRPPNWLLARADAVRRDPLASSSGHAPEQSQAAPFGTAPTGPIVLDETMRHVEPPRKKAESEQAQRDETSSDAFFYLIVASAAALSAAFLYGLTL